MNAIGETDREIVPNQDISNFMISGIKILFNFQCTQWRKFRQK